MKTKIIIGLCAFLSALMLSAIFSSAFAQKKVLKDQQVTIKKGVNNRLNIIADKLDTVKIVLNKVLVATYYPPIKADTAIFTKNYNSLQDAMDAAILQGKKTIIINDSVISNTDVSNIGKHIKDELHFKAAGTFATINFKFEPYNEQEIYGLYVKGLKTFDNIVFNLPQAPPMGLASTIHTEENQDDSFNLFFNNCRFTGDWNMNLQSSTSHGAATFIGCALDAVYENIQFYSQAGPKTLIMRHCTIKAKTSHCIYSHHNNNHIFDDVVCLGSGNLALNIYQTSHDLPGRSEINTFNNCRNADGARSIVMQTLPMWRLASNYCRTQVTNCDFPVYEWRGVFDMVNSHIFNAGNGSNVSGDGSTITNCTGELWLSENKDVVVRNCNLQNLRMSNGNENIQVYDTKIDGLWVNKLVSATLFNSPFNSVYGGSDETVKNVTVN